jgi:hypothetical protein
VFELNVPNVLTVFRILLVPVLVTALLSGFSSDALAAGVFILASFTDALDGWLARRQKSESNFGKLMDPLADKLLVTSALVSLPGADQRKTRECSGSQPTVTSRPSSQRSSARARSVFCSSATILAPPSSSTITCVAVPT